MAAWSSSALIPRERIADCVRWQFASVGMPQEAPPPAEPQPGCDAEALHRAYLEGHAAGHAAGEAAGRAQASAEAQAQFDSYCATRQREAAARLQALFSNAEARLDEAAQDIAHGTLEIACALAREVLRHELATRPEALEPALHEALATLLADGRSARVRLAPSDFELLGAPLRAEHAAQAVTLLADAALQPGDCLIESAGTVLDAGIQSRWSRAVASLGLALPWRDEEASRAA